MSGVCKVGNNKNNAAAATFFPGILRAAPWMLQPQFERLQFIFLRFLVVVFVSHIPAVLVLCVHDARNMGERPHLKHVKKSAAQHAALPPAGAAASGLYFQAFSAQTTHL